MVSHALRRSSGGLLSLTKYIACMNDLIVQLERLDLCCAIGGGGIKCSPKGYADDLAAATLS